MMEFLLVSESDTVGGVLRAMMSDLEGTAAIVGSCDPLRLTPPYSAADWLEDHGYALAERVGEVQD